MRKISFIKPKFNRALKGINYRSLLSKRDLLILFAILLVSISFLAGSQKVHRDSANPPKKTTNLELVESAPLNAGNGPNLPPFIENQQDNAVGKKPTKFSGRSFRSEGPKIGDPSQVVIFTTHWCTDCKKNADELNEFLKKNYPTKTKVILVVTSTSKSQANYPPSNLYSSWVGPILLDDTSSSAARSWGAPSFPFTVIIGKSGQVVERHPGLLSTKDLESYIKLAEK